MSEGGAGGDTGQSGSTGSGEWLRTGSNYGLPHGGPLPPSMQNPQAPSSQSWGQPGASPQARRSRKAPMAVWIAVAVVVVSLVVLLVVWLT